MSRLIAALLVVAAAFALSAAQEAPKPEPLPRFPFGGSKSQIPFDVVEQDGQKAWRVAGRGNVRIEELIAGYSSATGKRVSYDSAAANASKNSVPYVGPDDGMLVPNAELGDFVSELLEGGQLTLVGHSGAKVRVVRLDDAAGFARVVEAGELAGLPDTEWVTLVRTGLQTSPRGYSRALQHYMRSGVQIGMEDDMLIATGRVAQVRNLENLITKLESAASGSDGMQVRSYDLPANVKSADAARVIEELFEEPTVSVQELEGKYTVRSDARRDVHVSLVPGANRLLVRARAADHGLVKSALDALK
ncbi:MAG: hypothetical protein H6841_04200 [Planctomycetes bacterium]|nr:hypothetical protein [Planctomycetota bacterium]MCB9934578.1 hypothetical protein [Planctomycetota bacterium]